MSIVVTHSRGHGWPLLCFFLLTFFACFDAAAGNYRHIPGHSLRDATPEEIAAAEGVEAMMMDLLLQQMRKSVQESELMPASQGERIFRQMLDNEYARSSSSQGLLGIKDLVLAEIRRKR